MNPKGSQNLGLFIIDDDEVDVENVRRAIMENDADHPLYVAHDGREALAMLRRGEVPTSDVVVLLDLNMPRMTGIEFLRELRKLDDFKHLPVVVLTTSDDERDIVDAYEFNVAGYILKPVTFDSFVKTMATLDAYWSLQELPS